MKRIIFTPFVGGKVILFLLVFACLNSCSKGGGGEVDPPSPPAPPPPPSGPQINSFTPANNIAVHYSGSDSGIVSFAWNATVNGSVTFDGIPVQPVDSKSVFVGYENRTLILRLTDAATGANVQEARNVTITVDPVLAKMTGQAGQTWKIVDILIQSSSGSTHWVPDCVVDDVFKYYPNCTFQTFYGTNQGCPTGTVTNRYLFDPSTKVLKAVGAIPAQPDRVVTFSSATTMEHTYSYNGSVYTLYYQKI